LENGKTYDKQISYFILFYISPFPVEDLIFHFPSFYLLGTMKANIHDKQSILMYYISVIQIFMYPSQDAFS